jgi:hypothetical protein
MSDLIYCSSSLPLISTCALAFDAGDCSPVCCRYARPSGLFNVAQGIAEQCVEAECMGAFADARHSRRTGGGRHAIEAGPRPYEAVLPQ